MLVVNKNTTQLGMSGNGRTGLQVTKFIPAPRVYVALPLLASPASPSYGATPSGWTDLGSVLGNAKVDYKRQVKDVTTGLDGYFRGSYSTGSAVTVEFSLEQLDDVAVELISGLSPASYSSTYASYALGSTDLATLAMLIVTQDKISGKEIQFYNPYAQINFQFDSAGDALSLKCTAYLPYYVSSPNVAESCMGMTVFSSGITPVLGFGATRWDSDPYGSPSYGGYFGFGASTYDSSLYG